MASAIKFGTDGWRAAIAEEYTFDNVRIVTQAVADYLHEAGLARAGWWLAMILVSVPSASPPPPPRCWLPTEFMFI